MVNEQVSNQVVSISFKAAKLSGKVLLKALSAAFHYTHDGFDKSRVKTGQQSLKSLMKSNEKLDNFEIKEDNLYRELRKFLKSNGVSFAVQKDAIDKSRCYIHFRGKDADTISNLFDQAVKKYERANTLKNLDYHQKLEEMVPRAEKYNSGRQQEKGQQIQKVKPEPVR